MTQVAGGHLPHKMNIRQLHHIFYGGDDMYCLGVSTGAQALSEVLPTIARQKTDRGGFMVLRPDSGDPVEAVLMGLAAGEKVFGVDTNALGFKVPRGAPGPVSCMMRWHRVFLEYCEFSFFRLVGLYGGGRCQVVLSQPCSVSRKTAAPVCVVKGAEVDSTVMRRVGSAAGRWD